MRSCGGCDGIYIFGSFWCWNGKESVFEAALGDVVTATRQRGVPGGAWVPISAECAAVLLHSRWKDVEAFEAHAKLPHTEKFLERVESCWRSRGM